MKRKPIINFLCIFISILLIGSAAGLMFNVVRACETTSENLIVHPEKAKNIELTDTNSFLSYFSADMEELAYATGGDESSKMIKELKNKKEKTVDVAFASYNKKKAKYIEEYLFNAVMHYGDDEYSLNEDAEYIVPQKNIKIKIATDNHSKFVQDIEKIINGTKGLGFLNYSDLIPEDKLSNTYFNYKKKFDVYDGNLYIFEIDELDYANKSPKKYIERSFNIFLNTVNENMYYPEYGDIYNISSGLKYYVIDNTTGKVTTNISSDKKITKNEAINYIKASKIYYANIGGEIEHRGFKKLINNWHSGAFFVDTYDCYVTLDTSQAQSYDQYFLLEKTLKTINNSNIQRQFIISVIATLISIILFITVLINSSKKRCFIDKLFTDIHFAVSVAIGIVIILLAVYIFDNHFEMIYNGIAPYIIGIVASTIWAVVCEFFTSFVRVCKSEKKLHENCVIFLISRWFARKITKICKIIKSVFVYKPDKLKKTSILLVIGLLFADSSLAFFLIFSLFCEEFFFVMLSILLLAALNIFAAYRWIKYLISLDKIIVSATNRTVFSEDIDKLPQSLKVLQESMKYTNDELRFAVEKAVKDERLKTELITNVSHDLKTPLTSIITYVDLLNNCDIKDKKAKEYIKVLDEKGLKLKRLIDDLIEASKVSSGNIILNSSDINLSELVVQAVGEVEEDFSKAMLEIKYKLSDKQPIIFADGNKTFRVVENLLSNAKKYSAKGSRVYISVYEEEGFGVFEIKNVSATPLDISPDELTERFVRGDKSRTNEGNGLGLSIAKELCSAMNGKLEIVIDGDLFKAKVILPNKSS